MTCMVSHKNLLGNNTAAVVLAVHGATVRCLVDHTEAVGHCAVDHTAFADTVDHMAYSKHNLKRNSKVRCSLPCY